MKTELQNFIRSGGFAWPGGYPLALQGDPIMLGLYEDDGEPIAYSELTAGAL